jgi:hypothetical protein
MFTFLPVDFQQYPSRMFGPWTAKAHSVHAGCLPENNAAAYPADKQGIVTGSGPVACHLLVSISACSHLTQRPM